MVGWQAPVWLVDRIESTYYVISIDITIEAINPR